MFNDSDFGHVTKVDQYGREVKIDKKSHKNKELMDLYYDEEEEERDLDQNSEDENYLESDQLEEDENDLESDQIEEDENDLEEDLEDDDE